MRFESMSPTRSITNSPLAAAATHTIDRTAWTMRKAAEKLVSLIAVSLALMLVLALPAAAHPGHDAGAQPSFSYAASKALQHGATVIATSVSSDAICSSMGHQDSCPCGACFCASACAASCMASCTSPVVLLIGNAGLPPLWARDRLIARDADLRNGRTVGPDPRPPRT